MKGLKHSFIQPVRVGSCGPCNSAFFFDSSFFCPSLLGNNISRLLPFLCFYFRLSFFSVTSTVLNPLSRSFQIQTQIYVGGLVLLHPLPLSPVLSPSLIPFLLPASLRVSSTASLCFSFNPSIPSKADADVTRLSEPVACVGSKKDSLMSPTRPSLQEPKQFDLFFSILVLFSLLFFN